MDGWMCGQISMPVGDMYELVYISVMLAVDTYPEEGAWGLQRGKEGRLDASR